MSSAVPAVSSAVPSVSSAVPAVVAAGLAAGALALVVLPLLGLVMRAPWSSLVSDLRAHEAFAALRLSLETSLGALGLSIGLGVPLAWILARRQFPGRSLIRALVTLPMVLPPVVGGIALLYAFGKKGLAGRILYDLTGWRLVFTTSGAIVAEAFVSMPFLIVTAEAAFRSLDRRSEEAAATLGASPSYRFR
ncbi:MAG: ABC transporter permease subunit, partial [Actinomycetota bacterium]|nr:ABC transporter permease subunit [Actinomycetota bacterium]